MTEENVRLSNARVGVVRCLHIAGRDENWRIFSVFYIYVVHEEKNYKVMIDRAFCQHHHQDRH